MPVWRDDWKGESQIIVISPFDLTPEGRLFQASVLLNEAQAEAVVTVRDAAGRPFQVRLPRDLLDGERRNVETNTTLQFTPLRGPHE